MAVYKIGNYTFKSQAEYNKAKSELDFVKRVTEKYNINDPQIAGKILEKFKPETAIGRQFCEKLENICRKNGAIRQVSASCEMTPSNMVYYDAGKIEILRRLKKYNKTYECTCLECGYTGPMGVIVDGNMKKRIIAFIIAIIIFILFVPRLYWGFGVTLGGSVILALILLGTESVLKANQKKLYCPNCEKILYTK